MKCQTQKNKNLIASIILITGILVGVCAKFLTHNTTFHIEYLYGIACGLITSALLVMLIGFIRTKNPKTRQEDFINEQDERNQLIALHSSKLSFLYLSYSITIAFVIDLFIPLNFHYTALFFILSASALEIIARSYYKKRF